MKKKLLQILRYLAQPFLGKGFIDSHFPFLIGLFQKVYSTFETETRRIVNIPLGCKLIVNPQDIGVGIPLIFHGSYEPKQTQLFLEHIKSGDTIVDIGANIGYYSILAAKKTGPAGMVIAFEPDTANLTLIKENVILNRLENIQIEEKGITNTDGKIHFFSSALSKGDSRISLDSNKATSVVQGITLDTYLRSNKKIDLIKIDIEGAEIMALQGAKNILSTNYPVLFIEYNPSSIVHFGYQPDELIKLIGSYGFCITHIIDETTSTILTYSTSNLAKVMGHTTFCNLLCSKGKK